MVLKNLHVDMTGIYTCEVSTEGIFETVKKSSKMTVIGMRTCSIILLLLASHALISERAKQVVSSTTILKRIISNLPPPIFQRFHQADRTYRVFSKM